VKIVLPCLPDRQAGFRGRGKNYILCLLPIMVTVLVIVPIALIILILFQTFAVLKKGQANKKWFIITSLYCNK